MTSHLLRPALRHPLVHFAAIGAVLFVVQRAWRPVADGPPDAATRPRIVITSDRVRLLRTEFERRWGAPPSAGQQRALIARTVEEEILYREARALALDFGDGSVRRRLIEKARAVSRRPAAGADELYGDALALGLEDDVVIRRLLAEKMRLFLQDEGGVAIGDAELRAYLEQNRTRFVQPETVSFTHVFLSRGAHRERLEADAATTLVALGAQPPSPEVGQRSDPFPLGGELRAHSHSQLMGRFGKGFADALMALEPGRWAGPIASPYGLHLVWVHEHAAERLPPLDDVREAITLALMKQRAAASLERGLARLRSLYDVRVEEDGLDLAGDDSVQRGPTS